MSRDGYGEPVAKRSLYDNRDPREEPFYGIPQAADYLKMSASTLRPWVVGQRYLESQDRTGSFKPLIKPAAVDPVRLSFNNLVELYVIATLRRSLKLDLTAIRKTIQNTRDVTGAKRPLLTKKFATDGVRVFLDEPGFLELSSGGGRQGTFREISEAMSHIEYISGAAARLFLDRSRLVVADPLRSFGKPTIDQTRVTVEAIASFRKAGDSVSDIAKEFSLPHATVASALSWHEAPRLAA